MKIKVFGKNLFEYSKSGDSLQGMKAETRFNTGAERLAKEKHLIDFHGRTGGDRIFGENNPLSFTDWAIVEMPGGGAVAAPKAGSKTAKSQEKKPAPAQRKELTPKEVFQLKTLNDDAFVLKTGDEYVDEQISVFKDKLGMIKEAEYDMDRGTVEIASMLMRMENRKKYKEFGAFYEQYPYTTTAKMLELVKAHDYLKLGQVEQFLADMPKEAMETMKGYTAHTKAMCGKEPVYYIIANKKDFQKSEKRRDPILLAQSPFGHVWQILGAWDEEMLFLDEL